VGEAQRARPACRENPPGGGTRWGCRRVCAGVGFRSLQSDDIKLIGVNRSTGIGECLLATAKSSTADRLPLDNGKLMLSLAKTE
jgi:hypothetical protein